MKQSGISSVVATIIIVAVAIAIAITVGLWSTGMISLFTNPEYKYETEVYVYTYVAIGIETVENNPDIPEYDKSVTEPPYIVQRHPILSPARLMVYSARVKGQIQLYTVGMKVTALKPLEHISVYAVIYNKDGQHPPWVGNPIVERTERNVPPGWYWAVCWLPIHESEFPCKIIISVGIQSEGGLPL